MSIKPLWRTKIDAPQESNKTHNIAPIKQRTKSMCIFYGIYCLSINTLRPGDAYTRQWTGSGLAQVMANRWVDVKSSLPEPMMTYYNWTLWNSLRIVKMYLKVPSANWRPPCPGLNVLNVLVFTTVHCYPRITFPLETFKIIRPEQDGHQFTSDILKCIFINENHCLLTKCHQRLNSMVQFTINQIELGK